ncbi:MAG TPA: hypothetical protein VGM93_10490 [Acidimicrobiales bacterium]
MNDDEIRLVLPAIPAYARVARLTVAGLATRLGFSYDEVEDLRIAVGEACSILMSGPGGSGSAGPIAAPDAVTGRLTVLYRIRADALEIEASTDPAEPLVVGELTDQILAAVVDEHEIESGAHRVLLLKHHG